MRFFLAIFALFAMLFALIPQMAAQGGLRASQAGRSNDDCFKNSKPGCNCPQNYSPVRAPNGCTYSNLCAAKCANAL